MFFKYFDIMIVWEGNSLSDCFENWHKKEASYLTLPSIICWFIWLERNKFIFEGSKAAIFSIVSKVKSLVPSVNLVKKVKVRIIQSTCLITSIVCWFDGAAHISDLRCGAGGIIKISENSVYKWTFNYGQGINTRAKLMGAWATLFLMQRLNLDVFQVIGDSKIIIEWLKDRGNLQIASLMGWMDRIKLLKNTFIKIHFTHVYRELNMDADFLSKKALTKTEDKLEYSQWVDGNEGPTLSINLF